MTSTIGPRSNRRKKLGAFTLMELVLVMLIIAMASAIAAPSLHNFISGRKSHDASAQVLSLCQYARTRAISSGGVYRLNLDAQTRTYWLTRRDGAVFRELGEEFGRRFTLPANATARWNAPDVSSGLGQAAVSTGAASMGNAGMSPSSFSLAPSSARASGAATHDYIDFYPDGRVDAWNLELIDSNGRTTLGCKSETEALVILERDAR